MSREYDALLALRQPPERPRTGDMWLCKRLGIVAVATGHRRGTKRGAFPTSVYLYHWGKPAMLARPCDWRDNDPNGCSFDPINHPGGETWRYLGNLFDMLPYKTLSGG